jgi:Helix-turn-helix
MPPKRTPRTVLIQSVRFARPISHAWSPVPLCWPRIFSRNFLSHAWSPVPLCWPRIFSRNFLPFWENPPQQFSWKPNRGLPQLPKSIHTERHKTLCELLKAYRKSAGLTQTVVARRLGKPPSYVANRRLDVFEFMEVAAAIGFDPCALIRSLDRK